MADVQGHHGKQQRVAPGRAADRMRRADVFRHCLFQFRDAWPKNKPLLVADGFDRRHDFRLDGLVLRFQIQQGNVH
ncbi:MAG: hypothetical protein A3H49_12935 [Nitrospirae bacterium RIFCSPLOWO2_02_FULL_62_14]|nr:MAG: hypothetical protein A3H49_12935 [Nitrospirae bacterium RIFCSPLOWO2_02_FULL_62_14]